MNAKVIIEDRNYESWKIIYPESFPNVDPLENKLFNEDKINMKDGKVVLVHSPVRVAEAHPGILVLENGKTYGKRGNKFLYKCIPDDRHLPIFLVPYGNKKTTLSKSAVNKYCTFKFVDWNSKHPNGLLTNSLGDVSELSNFYEYQLYCKSLNASIQKFTIDTAERLKNYTEDEIVKLILKKYPAIEDRVDSHRVISIDPKGSADFDDAMSLTGDGNKKTISIYIANVPLWMEALNLWSSFSQRISTIYLPDRRRPMLPTRLSECLCSLKEGHMRFAFVCQVSINGEEIEDVKMINALIRVDKNYRYEEKELLEDGYYQRILELVKMLSKKYKYGNTKVRHSHELVSYLMILMNYYCAKKMIENKNGIYRSAVLGSVPSSNDGLPESIATFLTQWNSSSGQYQSYSESLGHELLNLENYIHITSPIRRLVDLLNMIQLQCNLGGFEPSKECTVFFNNWFDKIEYINTTMRAIRRVQSECSLLEMCYNEKNVLSKGHQGYLFDKIQRMDGMYQYVVYLYDLKIATRLVSCTSYDNNSITKFKLFLFNDEDRLKKKVRIMVQSNP